MGRTGGDEMPESTWQSIQVLQGEEQVLGPASQQCRCSQLLLVTLASLPHPQDGLGKPAGTQRADSWRLTSVLLPVVNLAEADSLQGLQGEGKQMSSADFMALLFFLFSYWDEELWSLMFWLRTRIFEMFNAEPWPQVCCICSVKTLYKT